LNEIIELENLKVEVCTIKNNGANSVKKRVGFIKNYGPNLKAKER
jgi:hypothetical protein